MFGQQAGRDEDGIAAIPASNTVRVHPQSALRRYWETTIIALTGYTIVVLPFRAAFHLEYYRDLGYHHNLIQQIQVCSCRNKDHCTRSYKFWARQQLQAMPVHNKKQPGKALMLSLRLQVDWMLAMDVFVDVFLMMDVVLNFHTGYIKEQVPEPSMPQPDTSFKHQESCTSGWCITLLASKLVIL